MSTIERLAKMAQETTPDQWVSIFSELHEQIVDLEQQLEAAERREKGLRETLHLARQLFIKYEMDVDVSPTADHRIAMRALDAAIAHSAQEKADAAE